MQQTRDFSTSSVAQSATFSKENELSPRLQDLSPSQVMDLNQVTRHHTQPKGSISYKRQPAAPK